MNLDEARDVVQENLSKARFEHTLRVEETALKLAEQYRAAENEVALAAIFHDYAKCFTVEELRERVTQYKLPTSLLNYHFELWHGPVGAKIAEYEYGIKQNDVLNAIYYHTTGRKDMSLLEKIIFVADYIEPGRIFPGVDEIRKLAMIDLQKAERKALKNTITYLMEKDGTIHPDSFFAYNDLTDKMKER